LPPDDEPSTTGGVQDRAATSSSGEVLNWRHFFGARPSFTPFWQVPGENDLLGSSRIDDRQPVLAFVPPDLSKVRRKKRHEPAVSCGISRIRWSGLPKQTTGVTGVNDLTRERLKDIKSKVRAMRAERLTLDGPSARTATPSQIWRDCMLWDYMLGLPEDAFDKLRIHTYHFTGDNYQRYLEEVGVDTFRANWDALVATTPPEYLLSEPEGGFGFTVGDGRLVSMDVMRFQEAVNVFLQHGVMEELQRRPTTTILEIGAGYGGLIHQLSRFVRGTFVIVDLPETLLFSASYLTMNQPDRRVYVYDAGTVAQALQDYASYDFILLPTYALDGIRHLRFDLVMNVGSMQEMRDDQVRAYVDFIHETLSGVFFSWNSNRHPRNAELGNLSELLQAEFDATEVPTRGVHPRKRKSPLKRLGRYLRSAGNRLDPPLDAGDKMRFRIFLCRPKAGES